MATVFSQLQLLLKKDVASKVRKVGKYQIIKSGKPGRPAFHIIAVVLEDLQSIGYLWQMTAKTLGVSR